MIFAVFDVLLAVNMCINFFFYIYYCITATDHAPTANKLTQQVTVEILENCFEIQSQIWSTQIKFYFSNRIVNIWNSLYL